MASLQEMIARVNKLTAEAEEETEDLVEFIRLLVERGESKRAIARTIGMSHAWVVSVTKDLPVAGP